MPSRTEIRKSQFFLRVTAAAVALTPFTLHAEAPTPSTPQVTLREVVETGLIGIQKEPAEIHVKIRNSARKYVSYRRGTLTQREIEEWTKQCSAKVDSDDFCPLILGLEPVEVVPEDEEIREEDRGEEATAEAQTVPPSTKETLALLKKADFVALKRASTSSIYRSLRKFKDWSQLQPMVERALRESSRQHCENPAIATGLAQKAEMYLPDPQVRKTAFELYEKVIDCPTGEIPIRARFRYSLFKIEDGACNVADPLLEKIYNEADGEYKPRALYWRAQCAKTRGANLRFKALAQRLLKEYPLSYHSIVLNRADVAKLSRVMGVAEPIVLLRSLEKPKVNAWIRAIEGLQSIGADEVARRVIARVLEPLMKTEPELRLYIGALANQVGDPVGQFRFLTSVFRDAPHLISQNTLKLFYPLKNFPMIQKYATETDPYFVASLIRQESGFNPWAMSRVGARGLMQIMPATARRMERVSKNQLLNPQTNIRLGTRYIANMVNRFDRDAELALAAYNAGPERVDEWKKRYVTSNRMLFLDLIPYKETRDYVVLISRNYFWYNNLYGDQLGVPARVGGRMATPAARELASSASSKKLIFTLFQ